MTHLSVLALFIVVVARDLVGESGARVHLPVLRDLSPAAILLSWLLPMAMIALAVHLALRSLARVIDESGAHRAVIVAGMLVAWSRVLIVIVQAWGVLVVGSLDLVRGWIGNHPGVDEVLVSIPPILTMALGWSSYYSIDRRVHEASVIGSLDRGESVPPLVSRMAYVTEQIRHNVLFVFVPVTVMLIWWEGLQRIALFGAHRFSWARSAVDAQWPLTVVHLAGVVVIATFMPLVLRWVWRTDRLGPGPLRDRLVALGDAHKVGFRDVLVWRTHLDMANGAVIGVASFARYVLLTDTLLERLPIDRVEAVMAHEVGHARRRHIPWLMGAMIATLSVAFDGAALITGLFTPEGAEPGIVDLSGVMVLGWILTIVVFGYVSRRFELQADAFAAQHLSGFRSAGARTGTAPTIAPEAADAMIGALSSVARLNHSNPRRFTLRHGSIRWRQHHLANLVGVPADRLPIDRTVAIMKWVILAALAGTIALAVFVG